MVAEWQAQIRIWETEVDLQLVRPVNPALSYLIVYFSKFWIFYDFSSHWQTSLHCRVVDVWFIATSFVTSSDIKLPFSGPTVFSILVKQHSYSARYRQTLLALTRPEATTTTFLAVMYGAQRLCQ